MQKQKTVDDDFFGLNFNQQNIDPFSKLEANPVNKPQASTAASNDLFDFDSVFKSPMPTSVTMPDLFNNVNKFDFETFYHFFFFFVELCFSFSTE